jgi:dUTP pyrophosphatase
MINELDNYSKTPEFKFAVIDGLGDDFIPTKGSSHAAGWDAKITENIFIKEYETALISLGIRCYCPSGWWLEVRPRSSAFLKKNLHFLYGVVDSDYEGIISAVVQYIPIPSIKTSNILKLEKGERIAQLIPHKVNEIIVKSISNEEYNILCKQRGLTRGTGGFGSSGK